MITSDKVNWRFKSPTEKQQSAIINMANAIGWSSHIPDTRGECADYINELKVEIQNRLSLTGQFRPRDSRDDFSDFYDPDRYNHELEGDWGDFCDMF